MVQIDMEMPKSCADCPFKIPSSDNTEFICKILWLHFILDEQNKSRSPICPLREVKK